MKFIKTLTLITETISDATGQFSYLRYDERGSHEDFVEKLLGKEIQQFYSVIVDTENAKKQFITSLEILKHYKKIKSNLEERNPDYIRKKNDLLQALKELNSRNKKTKEEIHKKYGDVPKPEEFSQKAELLLGLARQRHMNTEEKESNSNAEILEEKMGKLEREIEEKFARGDDIIDSLIEWTRIHEKLTQLDSKRIGHFPHSEIQALDGTQEYVIASFSSTHFGAMSSERKHPLDSPLAKMVSYIDRKQNHNIPNFLFFSERPFSFFEMGIFKCKGITLRNNVVPKKSYSKITHSINPSNNQLEHISPQACEYYDRFKLPPVPSEGIISLNLAPEFIEKIAVLLTMSLSHYMTEWRKQAGLPQGNPVVCLIISSSGEILSWAVNTSDTDLIRHAEVNALNIYYQNNPGIDHLPADCYLFISLKSCHMCAGAIRDSIKSTDTIQVIYCQNDPGQKGTAIENFQGAIQKQAKDDRYLLKSLDKKYDPTKGKNAALSLTQNCLRKISQKFVNELCGFLLTKASFAQEEQKYLSYIEDFLKINQLNLQSATPTTTISNNSGSKALNTDTGLTCSSAGSFSPSSSHDQTEDIEAVAPGKTEPNTLDINGKKGENLRNPIAHRSNPNDTMMKAADSKVPLLEEGVIGSTSSTSSSFSSSSSIVQAENSSSLDDIKPKPNKNEKEPQQDSILQSSSSPSDKSAPETTVPTKCWSCCTCQ